MAYRRQSRSGRGSNSRSRSSGYRSRARWDVALLAALGVAAGEQASAVSKP